MFYINHTLGFIQFKIGNVDAFPILILMFSLIFIGGTWYFFKKNKTKQSLLFILLLGLILRLFIIQSPILNDWDEKYHALVSKSLISNPIKPTLFSNPVLDYDPTIWVENNVWLSKPPVPLWIMAGSIKLFGYSAFSVRLPSVILSLFAIFITFCIGKLLYNKEIGLIAAFLYSINGLLIELVGGKVSSDHVEVMFIVLFELSVYFIIKFILTKEKRTFRYLFLGVLIGLTFLSKWQVSLLFFPLWFFTAYLSKNFTVLNLIKNTTIILASFLITISSWILLIFNLYPIETMLIYNGLISPLGETIQNHDGAWYYYLNKIRVIYGELIYLPLLYSIYLLFNNKRWNDLLIFLWWLIPILIFSFAATKRYTYLLISAPAFFILISVFILKTLPKIKLVKKFTVLFIILLISLPLRYSFERVKLFQNNEVEISEYIEWKQKLELFANSVEQNKTIVFNLDKNIEAMFYTDLIVYANTPDSSVIDNLKTDGYYCYIFDNNRYQIIK